MSKFKKAVWSILIGLVNGMFGAGGGMLTVPLLKKLGYNQNDAQANAISVIFPLSVISAVMYYFQGNIKIEKSLIYLLPGIIGAFVGTVILKKINPKYLKIIFSLFMIWAGGRMLFK